jgi:hypothetical protein
MVLYLAKYMDSFTFTICDASCCYCEGWGRKRPWRIPVLYWREGGAGFWDESCSRDGTNWSYHIITHVMASAFCGGIVLSYGTSIVRSRGKFRDLMNDEVYRSTSCHKQKHVAGRLIFCVALIFLCGILKTLIRNTASNFASYISDYLPLGLWYHHAVCMTTFEPTDWFSRNLVWTLRNWRPSQSRRLYFGSQ